MGEEVAIVTNSLGALPAEFASVAYDPDELGGGISGAFGVLGYRGKVWRVRYRGDEHNLINEETGDPLGSVEVVIVKAPAHLSKLYYANGYTEGQAIKPDCWSSNGVTPDPTVVTPQCPACGVCPMNAIGSRVTDEGKPAKACRDHKRLVVAPLADLENEVWGGPMMLRIPAASLSDLNTFSNQLKQAGYPYFAVAVRLRFDIDMAYPKLVYSAIRVLTGEEAAIVKELRDDPRTARILNEEPEAVAGGEAGPLFEQPPQALAPAAAGPAPRPAPRPAPGPAPAPASAPVTQPVKMAPAPVAQPRQAKAQPAMGVIKAAVANPTPKPTLARVKAPAPAPAPATQQEEAPPEFASSLDEELARLMG